MTPRFKVGDLVWIIETYGPELSVVSEVKVVYPARSRPFLLYKLKDDISDTTWAESELYAVPDDREKIVRRMKDMIHWLRLGISEMEAGEHDPKGKFDATTN